MRDIAYEYALRQTRQTPNYTGLMRLLKNSGFHAMVFRVEYEQEVVYGSTERAIG